MHNKFSSIFGLVSGYIGLPSPSLWTPWLDILLSLPYRLANLTASGRKNDSGASQGANWRETSFFVLISSLFRIRSHLAGRNFGAVIEIPKK